MISFYEEGRQDCLNGVPRFKNPYLALTYKYNQWNEGWLWTRGPL